MENFIYLLSKAVVRIFYLKNVKITVKGYHNLPKKAAIIVANHNNPWDPTLITIAARRLVHFFTANILFKNVLHRIFLREIGQMPVQSGLEDINNVAFSEAKEHLKRGHLVGIFPYPYDIIKKRKVLYAGVIRLIMENNVPVIPVMVKLNEKRKWKSFFDVNFNEAVIIIGKPLAGFRKECARSKGQKAGLCLARGLMNRIESLK